MFRWKRKKKKLIDDKMIAGLETTLSINSNFEENDLSPTIQSLDIANNALNKPLLEYELDNYEQVVTLADRLIEGENLIVNVTNLSILEKKRTLEFLGGIIYTLQGKAQKIGPNAYVFISNENIT